LQISNRDESQRVATRIESSFFFFFIFFLFFFLCFLFYFFFFFFFFFFFLSLFFSFFLSYSFFFFFFFLLFFLFFFFFCSLSLFFFFIVFPFFFFFFFLLFFFFSFFFFFSRTRLRNSLPATENFSPVRRRRRNAFPACGQTLDRSAESPVRRRSLPGRRPRLDLGGECLKNSERSRDLLGAQRGDPRSQRGGKPLGRPPTYKRTCTRTGFRFKNLYSENRTLKTQNPQRKLRGAARRLRLEVSTIFLLCVTALRLDRTAHCHRKFANPRNPLTFLLTIKFLLTVIQICRLEYLTFSLVAKRRRGKISR